MSNIHYTRKVVTSATGDTGVHIHVDPSPAMATGDTYDAELLLPATARSVGEPYNETRQPASVSGVAKGASSTVGCQLPDIAQDHCIAIHTCTLKVTLHKASDPEDAQVRLLPVEIEQRDREIIG